MHDVINPATEQVIASVPQTDREGADAAIARAHEALPAWRAVAPGDRATLLRRFSDVVRDHVEELAQLEVANSGHTIGNARWEATNVANVLAYYAGAPERLFAQLMQVAGRAGRREGGAQVIVQTDYPEQTVYQALLRHDYARFAAHALEERRDLGLPPFSSQALLTAQAVRVRDALDFLAAARARARLLPEAAGVRIHDPVPLRIVRVARVERAQLLFESDGRGALHRLLRALLPGLDELARGAVQHWGIEIDPQEI